jgi:hypothetical protein
MHGGCNCLHHRLSYHGMLLALYHTQDTNQQMLQLPNGTSSLRFGNYLNSRTQCVCTHREQLCFSLSLSPCAKLTYSFFFSLTLRSRAGLLKKISFNVTPFHHILLCFSASTIKLMTRIVPYENFVPLTSNFCIELPHDGCIYRKFLPRQL